MRCLLAGLVEIDGELKPCSTKTSIRALRDSRFGVLRRQRMSGAGKVMDARRRRGIVRAPTPAYIGSSGNEQATHRSKPSMIGQAMAGWLTSLRRQVSAGGNDPADRPNP